MRGSWIAASVALALSLTACGTLYDNPPATNAPQTNAPQTNAPQTTERVLGGDPMSTPPVAGTTVNFTAGDVLVAVVVAEDNPTTRSFLAMLPMTLTFSDYAGKEKVATPTGTWDFTDAAGLEPKPGDLFSYMPWGNLGFFYDTDGNTFDRSLTKIGETYDLDQLPLLDGEVVTIAVAG